jgi:hypothetical protein
MIILIILSIFKHNLREKIFCWHENMLKKTIKNKTHKYIMSMFLIKPNESPLFL